MAKSQYLLQLWQITYFAYDQIQNIENDLTYSNLVLFSHPHRRHGLLPFKESDRQRNKLGSETSLMSMLMLGHNSNNKHTKKKEFRNALHVQRMG